MSDRVPLSLPSAIYYLNTDVVLFKHTRLNNNQYDIFIFLHSSCKPLEHVYYPIPQQLTLLPSNLYMSGPP